MHIVTVRGDVGVTRSPWRADGCSVPLCDQPFVAGTRRLARWVLAACMARTVVSRAPPRAQRPDSLGPEVRKYLRVSTPRVVLEHVQIIDGTGAAPTADRNITIEQGKITALSAGVDQSPREGTTVLDLRGYSVMPGIVGMHDHFWFSPGRISAPTQLWMARPFSSRCHSRHRACTWRTGSPRCARRAAWSPMDVRLKQAIEAGTVPGPHLDVTGPYLDGAGIRPSQVR